MEMPEHTKLRNTNSLMKVFITLWLPFTYCSENCTWK